MLAVYELITMSGLRILDIQQEPGQNTMKITVNVSAASTVYSDCQNESHALHGVGGLFVHFLALSFFSTNKRRPTLNLSIFCSRAFFVGDPEPPYSGFKGLCS